MSTDSAVQARATDTGEGAAAGAASRPAGRKRSRAALAAAIGGAVLAAAVISSFAGWVGVSVDGFPGVVS